mmetsp:Transcript_12151/g.41999  ORF Transcript_12151/g.41999 Transcript_12151/m.41999 type:complete len:164 (+) Transcript_12151:178-669(+)
MKPDWDRLMAENSHGDRLIADVDCTGMGKPICDKIGVEGFPTLKYGLAHDLNEYQGGRSYDDLDAFARTLKHACGVGREASCSSEEKALLETFLHFSRARLQGKVRRVEKAERDAQSAFDAAVVQINLEHDIFEAEYRRRHDAILSKGLRSARQVLSHSAKAA